MAEEKNDFVGRVNTVDEYGNGKDISVEEFRKGLANLAKELKEINSKAILTPAQKEKRAQDILDTLNSIDNPY